MFTGHLNTASGKILPQVISSLSYDDVIKVIKITLEKAFIWLG